MGIVSTNANGFINTSSITSTSITVITTTTTTTNTTVTTTITTITTVKTTIPDPVLLTSTSEFIYSVWNNTAGSDIIPSTAGLVVGNYYPSEPYQNVFDRNCTTKYTHFGHCDVNTSSPICGTNTGIYLKLQRTASLLVSIQICAANNLPERDPLTLTIEGSNQSSSALTLGSSWTLIYNGSTGLNPDPGRYAVVTVQYIPNNMISYASYRIFTISKRNITNSVQYSEVKLMGC